MEIRLSRHARRRARLYGISPATIVEVLKRIELSQGNHDFVTDVVGQAYPLKIVASTRGNVTTVITAYPLKRGGSR